MKRLFLLFCLLGLNAGATDFGTNVAGLTDYDPTVMWADKMFTARQPWGSVASPFDGSCVMDANGWPTAACGVVVDTWGVLTGQAGAYSLRFLAASNPTITIPSSAGWTLSGQSFGGGVGTATLTNDGTAGQLFLTFSVAVTQVSLMRPGHTRGTDIFNKAFISAIKPYKVIRTMDMTQTNGNQQKVWADRSPTTFSSRAQGPSINGTWTGATWEDICTLASLTSNDLWINIPALATDAYVTSLATFLQANCPTTTKFYVEISNELWNYQFSQSSVYYDRAACEVAPSWAPTTAYATWSQSGAVSTFYVKNGAHCYKTVAGGTSAGSGGPTGTGASNITDGSVTWTYIFDPTVPGVLNWDGDTNVFELSNRYNAIRGKQVSTLFSAVYGAAAMGPRIRMVYVGQFGQDDTVRQGLKMIQSQYGLPSQWFYCTGGAPYFWENQNSTSVDSTVTVNRLIEEYKQSIAGFVPIFQTFAAIANSYGLKVCHYEGGVGTTGNTGGNLTAKTNAQNDSRMTGIMQDFLRIVGTYSDVYTHYSFTGTDTASGHWGLYNDIGVPTVKSLAYEGISSVNPKRPRYNTSIFGSAYTYNSGALGPSGNTVVINQNGYVHYQVTAPGDGAYKLVIIYAVSNATTSMSVDVNGTVFNTQTLPNTSGVQTNLRALYPVLAAGTNTIGITMTTAGGPTVYSITLSDQ